MVTVPWMFGGIPLVVSTVLYWCPVIQTPNANKTEIISCNPAENNSLPRTRSFYGKKGGCFNVQGKLQHPCLSIWLSSYVGQKGFLNFAPILGHPRWLNWIASSVSRKCCKPVVPKLVVETHQCVATQFLVGRDTDKKHVLSPIETEQHMHIYSQVGSYALVHCKGDCKATRMVQIQRMWSSTVL